MDRNHFDALVKHLFVLRSRREGLRAFLAGLVAGGIGLATADDAVACKGKGGRCGNDRACCSGKCRIRRRKGKKQPKPKRRGQCACSTPQERCNDASDCCDFRQKCLNGTCSDCRKNGESCGVAAECCDFPNAACGTNGCGAGPVCCAIAGEACTADCDCCAPLTCQADGTCGGEDECSDLQEACDLDEDCCAPLVCANNAPREGCPPGPEKHCCVDINQSCESDCDCCGEAPCVDGTCGCRFDGEECRRDEDCCAPHTCLVGGTCGLRAPTCPANTNACAPGAEVPCGEGPLFAGCKCFRVGEFSFCARPTRCVACADDPDCRGQGGHPAALCIPCPLCLPPDPPTMCVVPCGV